MKKGQVSSEYMIILGVVIILAIGAALLLRESITTGGSITERQSQSYWTVAHPFSILGVKYAGTQLQLDVQNSLPQASVLEEIEIDGSDHTVDQTFAANERRVVTLTLGSSCGDPGDTYILEDINIGYRPAGGSSRTQAGEMPLVSSCS